MPISLVTSLALHQLNIYVECNLFTCAGKTCFSTIIDFMHCHHCTCYCFWLPYCRQLKVKIPKQIHEMDRKVMLTQCLPKHGVSVTHFNTKESSVSLYSFVKKERRSKACRHGHDVCVVFSFLVPLFACLAFFYDAYFIFRFSYFSLSPNAKAINEQ